MNLNDHDTVTDAISEILVPNVRPDDFDMSHMMRNYWLNHAEIVGIMADLGWTEEEYWVEFYTQ